MSERNQGKAASATWWAVVCVAYVLLSALCFALPSTPSLLALVEPFPWVPLLMGPPAMLLHRLNYAIPYLVTTVIVFGLLWLGVRYLWRVPGFSIVLFLLAAAFWFASGFLSYAPAF
jgi:hypothetical protein